MPTLTSRAASHQLLKDGAKLCIEVATNPVLLMSIKQ